MASEVETKPNGNGTQATTLALREEHGGALMPFDAARELPAIFTLADALMKARGFLPKHLTTSGEIAAVILAGRELGLPPMVSLRSLFLVEGKVQLDASLQLALVKAAGIKHRWIADGRDGKRAVLWMQRPGDEPHEHEYTIAHAQAAGLAGKHNWKAHAPAMLRARCVSGAVKAYCPDVGAGIGALSGCYVQDEIEEIAEAAPLVSNRAVDVAREAEPEAMATAQEQAKRRLEGDELAKAWIPDIDALPDARALEQWCAYHGYEMQRLHATPQGRVWTAVKKACAKYGVNPHDARKWLREAEPMPVEDDGEPEPPHDKDGVIVDDVQAIVESLAKVSTLPHWRNHWRKYREQIEALPDEARVDVLRMERETAMTVGASPSEIP